jgi:hypothetical protein
MCKCKENHVCFHSICVYIVASTTNITPTITTTIITTE